jgi:hypothetical protein
VSKTVNKINQLNYDSEEEVEINKEFFQGKQRGKNKITKKISTI